MTRNRLSLLLLRPGVYGSAVRLLGRLGANNLAHAYATSAPISSTFLVSSSQMNDRHRFTTVATLCNDGTLAVTPTPISRAKQLPQTIATLIRACESPTTSNDAMRHVTINGWVRSVRRMKNVNFVHISDGSTVTPLQAVLTRSQAAGLSTGASVQITGQWKASLPGSAQESELLAESVRILGTADPETYPVQKKYQTPEYLRTIPHLRARIPFNTVVLQLRSLVSSQLTNFFSENDFVQCYPPIITSSDSEGAGEVFVVSSEREAGHFFRSPKYLTVSTQLHLEALAAAHPRVWALSPTFRAERSDTNRHLSEFYMLEAEMSFVETLGPLLDLVEQMVRRLVAAVADSKVGRELSIASRDEHQNLPERWSGLLRMPPWTRITYKSAIDLLQNAQTSGRTQFRFVPQWGLALRSEHEKFIANHLGGPVFVTNYPQDLKPFYMKESQPDGSPGALGRTVECFDLLLPAIGELVGGSLREDRYDELIVNMKRTGLITRSEDQTTIKWYADLRRWGSVPHGGFGLGIERLLCYLAGIENIREASAFPRWMGRCDC